MSENRVSTVKMLESTKEIINSLDLIDGNQQQKLDYLVRDYAKFIDEAKALKKEVIPEISLDKDIEYINATLNNYLKAIASKVNKHLEESIIASNRNIEREITKCHNAFIETTNELKADAKYIDEKYNATKKIEEELETLKERDSIREEYNKELIKKNKELDMTLIEVKAKISVLEQEKEELLKYKELYIDKNEEYIKLENRYKALLEEANILKEDKLDKSVLEANNISLKSKIDTLETTLNTINNVLSTITNSKVEAESLAIKLQQDNHTLINENNELKKEIELLKMELKSKKED